MQCTMIIYVDDLPVTCMDDAATGGVIEALKAKYHDLQEHVGVKQSYLGITLDQSVTGMYSITVSMFIADVLKNVK